VILAQANDVSTIRLVLVNHHLESLAVYADGPRTNEYLDEDDIYIHEYVDHEDSEYAYENVHVKRIRARIGGVNLALTTSGSLEKQTHFVSLCVSDLSSRFLETETKGFKNDA